MTKLSLTLDRPPSQAIDDEALQGDVNQTTVNVPKRSIGEHVIWYLISQREIGTPSAASMVLPINLIIRESCGSRTTLAVE